MSADHPLIASPGAERLLAALAGDEPRDWRDLALCAEVSGDEFFPEKGGSTREAKAVCRRCEVTAECLEYALAQSQDKDFGIWGATSEQERRRLRRDRAATQKAA